MRHRRATAPGGHGLALLALVVGGLLGTGCRDERKEVLYDLAADARLARQVHADGVRSVVAPPATVYAGGSRAARRGAEQRLVSTAFLEWSDPRRREVWLDLERPDWGSGDVGVTLNRTALEPLSLEPGVQRYRVLLPPGSQRAGLNRLRLTFRGAAGESAPPPSGGPARLKGLSLRWAGSERVPPSPAVRTEAGAVVLSQAAGSRLEYGLLLPEAGEVRFAPAVRPGSGGPAVFRVELGVEGGLARELYRSELKAGESHGEIRLPLTGEAGRPALLVLQVDPGPGGEEAVGDWTVPRVVGRREPAMDGAAPPAPGPRLRDLRRRLEGAAVLLIVLDAAAAGHFGCYGYERDTTPAIDRIAAEGIVFERAYTPASYTRAAMASLWTSQHPEQHHHGTRPAGSLPENRLVLPEFLRDRGIQSTAFIGNPNAGKPAGLTRGFTRVEPLYLDENGRGLIPRASAFLEPLVAAVRDRPEGQSLIYAHYVEPHYPYDPLPPFDTRFGPDGPLPRSVRRDPRWIHSVNRLEVRPTPEERADLVRLYDGNLAAADHEIGLLRARLEALGLWDDLLFVIMSDHGEEFLEHGLVGHAAQVYEESIRIPLILRLPGQIRPRRVREPVDLLDVGATLADVFGVGPDTDGYFRGRSLLPLLAEGALPPREILSQSASERPSYSWLGGGLKLIHEPRWGKTELYDLDSDPGETEDLAAVRVASEVFRQSLYRWLRDLDRGAPATGAEPTLSAEDEAALRALGYVN